MRDFILVLLTCSVSMSALGLLLIAATPLLAKRYAAKTRYYIWLIIVVGLLSPLHPPRFFENPVFEVSIQAEALSAMSPADTGYVVITPEARLAGITPAEAAPFLLRFSPRQLLTALWVAGALAFLLYHAGKHIRFLYTARRWSKEVTDGGALRLLQALKEEMGIAGRVRLVLCPCVSTPMAMGFIRHRVLLPSMEYDEGELAYILTHELIHIRRRDLWYRSLTLLATAMHWFNPLIYWMGSRINLLSEISCDSEVVRGADADARMRYTETIIGVVRRRPRVETTAISTGFYSGKHGMKLRISAIMDTGKKRGGLLLLCAALVIALAPGSAFAVTVPPESAPAILSADAIEGIISGRFAKGSVAESHPAAQGEIDMDQAIAIAKAAAPYYMRQLVARGDYDNIKLKTFSTELKQVYPGGQAETRMDVANDYWEINLTGIVEEGYAPSFFVVIHAETGLVVEILAEFLPVDADAQLSPERMLSRYMEDLGVGGFAPSGEGDQRAGEIIDTKLTKNIGDGAVQAQAYIMKSVEEDPTEQDSESATIGFMLWVVPPDAQVLGIS